MEGGGTQEEWAWQREVPSCTSRDTLQKEWGGASLTPPSQSLLPCDYVVTKIEAAGSALVSREEGQCHSSVHSDAVFTLRP